jgi:hypothetical protein
MRATLPNGRPYELDYCFVFELQGGQIRRVREYMDTLNGWHQVFGTTPPDHPMVASSSQSARMPSPGP